MKYSIITFGCRVNQADSLGFEEELLAAGASPVPADQADVVVVNTCSVTATADQGARQTIRRVARQNPAARIIVTGCYATRRPGELLELPNVMRVVPNQDKPQLISILRPDRRGSNDVSPTDVNADVSTAERFGSGDGSCGAGIEPGVAGRTAFTLRVQTGCSEPCSYCIIPTTRGAPQSVPVGHLLNELERIAAAGFKEMALTGVHLGSYGRDLSPRSSLLALLTAFATAVPDSSRVRFRISSLEPMDCTPEVVDLVAGHDCFAPHFHLPLQHASDRMLAAMRRPYTIGSYAALTGSIRDRLPDASIGSDIIVGFPGESDRDFEALAGYLERSAITHAHVFPYSDRPGTEAAGLPGKVPGAIVRERSRRIRDIAAGLSARFRNSQIGSVHRALTIDDGSVAVTGNYLKVKIAAGQARNEWVQVAITGADGGMTGTVVG